MTNAYWLVGCHIIQSVLSLLISMVSARYLGPTNFGLINYAASLTAFFVPLAQLGLNSTLVHEIHSNRDGEGETLGSALGVSFFSSLLSIIGLLCFVSVVNGDERDTVIVCALYSISLIFQTTEMIQYWFQERLMAKYIAIISLIARFAVSVYRLFLLINGSSIYWFAIVNALDYFLITVALLGCYYGLGGGKLCFSLHRVSQLLRRSKYYILSGLMVVIFGQTDKVMLKLMCDNSASGYYSAAITCAGMTGFVFSAIIDSMRPVILDNKQKNEQTYEKNLIELYAIVMYMALLQSAVLTIGSGLVVRILYGSQYESAASILRVITWYSAFSYIGPVRNIWILAEGKQRYLWVINLTGAVFNVIGNYVIIPYWGAVGAAMISVITQMFTNFILCILIPAMRPCARHMISAINPRVLIEAFRSKERDSSLS